ncbi:DUF3047 domain-containing protein [Sphingoaurantiacus capsulatus]|uniref:DUF3047 domain-containing protein n=1 Tax=Sphingoaurantiacus capsulatus TaxID=1771310 RepID=A0ABV7X670_9SPHN
MSLGKLATFARFVAQQHREKSRIAAELEAAPAPFDTEGASATATVTLTAKDRDWKPSGVEVAAGDSFTVDAHGVAWMSQALAVGVEPRVALWVRIGGGAPIRKLIDNRTTFTAWATGAVELRLKALDEWASDAGNVLPAKPGRLAGAVTATVARWSEAREADSSGAPAGWHHLWRLGDGRVYAPTTDGIGVHTHGDVGILQLDVDVPITAGTTLDWGWCVSELPSRLAENLAVTHDYLSIAVEFENGQDLTYMWSAGLPEGHVFKCPLPYWCDRETHWVVRSGSEGLGAWHEESRGIAEDCRRAYGSAPRKVVRIWLIANSVFQRNSGRARFRDIRLTER